MGFVCIEKATGRVREWSRNDTPPLFDDAVHILIEQDQPPPDGTRWDGTVFVPEVKPKSQPELDREDAAAKVALAIDDRATSPAVRDALAALLKVLG